jgi:hypothetical protein
MLGGVSAVIAGEGDEDPDSTPDLGAARKSSKGPAKKTKKKPVGVNPGKRAVNNFMN